MPWWRRPWFELKILAVWVHILWERLGAARRVSRNEDHNDKNFTLTGSRHLGLEVGFAALVEVCLGEYARRLAPYDPRLLRPRLVPRVARLVRRLMGR